MLRRYQSILQAVPVPNQQVAHSMIRARLTLTDGTTPGALRYGAANILACIARGCRIVPDPVNAIPEEWAQHMAGACAFGQGVGYGATAMDANAEPWPRPR